MVVGVSTRVDAFPRFIPVEKARLGWGDTGGADLCWELSGQLSCGRSNQMWSVPHRVMLKFESLPRPAIRATGPCRMQRQLIEKSYGFMGTGIGPPRLRARSALAKDCCGRTFAHWRDRRLELGHGRNGVET